MYSSEPSQANQFKVVEEPLVLLKSACGEVIHGAINLKKPSTPYLEYLFHALAPFLLRAQEGWPNCALTIGLGAGEIPRFMRAHFPGCELHVAEISPEIIQLARTIFQCPPDSEKFTIHPTCGAEFIQQVDTDFDYILVDGFSADGEPGPLESADFYDNCRNALSPDGYLVLNLFPKIQNPEAQLRLLASCFGYQPLVIHCKTIANVVAILHRSEARPRFTPKALVAASEALSARTGVNLNLTTNLLFKALMTSPPQT